MVKNFKSEFRDDCGAVFLDRYPDEDDVIGWLKVHRMNDPIGIFSGKWADDAVKLIESLQDELKQLKKSIAKNKPVAEVLSNRDGTIVTAAVIHLQDDLPIGTKLYKKLYLKVK